MLKITHATYGQLEVPGILSEYFTVWYSETQFQLTWSSWVADHGSKQL